MEENVIAPVETPAPAPAAPAPVVEPATAAPAPAVGSAVHFVLDNGECRPAVVVRLFSGVAFVNLQQFTDGLNDGTSVGTIWRGSVSFSAAHNAGTWHWPE